jgi:hypothetical protein
MANYGRRLDRIEETISPQSHPQICAVFGDDNVEAAVARLRVARAWPDDGAHPVQVIRVRWG